jgi:hypothetical protein
LTPGLFYYILRGKNYDVSHFLRGENMAENNSLGTRSLTREEKKKIARQLIEGYKRMAALNLELAEEGLQLHDETGK